MHITSLPFFILVIITMTVYYSPFFKEAQTYVLVISSFYFYFSNAPVFFLPFMIMITINIVTSYYASCGKTKHKKLYAGVGVALNLSILAFFKYSPLIGRSFFWHLDSVKAFIAMLPLPIGISFITFHSISHLIDSYRTEYTKIPTSFKKHAVNTMLYIAFFPKILAGPIEKAKYFHPQIKKKKLGDIEWDCCFKNLVSGYFLKMVIADNLKNYTFWIAYPYFLRRSSFDLITMVYGYSIQIFSDFAGYSLIAIGIAGLFGYTLKINFNFPYIAQSFSEFWRRWHISLSTFLRDYLYIPLGGNRKGKVRTYFNLMAVMCLGGLWHGAAWSFAVWGAFHGLALSIERILKDTFTLPEHFVIKYIKMIFVFSLVTFAWILFKLQNFSYVIGYINAMVENITLNSRVSIAVYILLYSLPVVIYHAHYLFKWNRFTNSDIIKSLLYGILLFMIVTNSGSSKDFIYFQF